MDYKIYDIDNDNIDEISIITKKNKKDKYGNDLIIFKPYFENEIIKYKEIYRQNFYDLKPWKINIGNIDNDGETDFFIGVYKTTQYYKDLRNRPFFYSWNGEKLYKKWTGSYFSENDLIDMIFIDSLGKGYDQVVILEKISGRKYQNCRVSMYMWNGFGFQEIIKSSYLPEIKNIYILDGDISVITKSNLIIKLRLSKEKTLNIFKVI